MSQMITWHKSSGFLIFITALFIVGFGIVTIGQLVYRICAGGPHDPPLYFLLIRLFCDVRLFGAIYRTLILTFISLSSQMLLVLILVRFVRSFSYPFKILLVTPALISSATSALIFFLWFSPAIGPIDSYLRAKSITSPHWFLDVIPMAFLIILIDSWQWLPFLTAVAVHQKERIPETYYEQARIEGASEWLLWRRVTIPMLLPTFVILGTLRLFDWIRLYDIAFVLFGGGGPGNSMETISVYTHKLIFQPGNERYGAMVALSYLTLTLITLLLCLRFRTIDRLMPWRLKAAE